MVSPKKAKQEDIKLMADGSNSVKS